MRDSKVTFPLTWLTCAPLLRGNWVAMVLSLAPAGMAILALVPSLSDGKAINGGGLLAGALFLSLSATLIQAPAFAGRVELTEETLTVVGRLSGRRGRLEIPRKALRQVGYVPLTRPPAWLPYLWATAELVCAAGAFSTGSNYWYWLIALALGLALWPLMVARYQSDMLVVLTYERPGAKHPGLIRAWGTPHQASSLVNTLRGKIDWPERESAEQEE